MDKRKKNAEENGREAAQSARLDWGRGWERLGARQRAGETAGELLLTIESMPDEVLVEQFGTAALPGLQVVQNMLAAMQRELE